MKKPLVEGLQWSTPLIGRCDISWSSNFGGVSLLQWSTPLIGRCD
jgi:hypothetical protein